MKRGDPFLKKKKKFARQWWLGRLDVWKGDNRSTRELMKEGGFRYMIKKFFLDDFFFPSSVFVRGFQEGGEGVTEPSSAQMSSRTLSEFRYKIADMN